MMKFKGNLSKADANMLEDFSYYVMEHFCTPTQIDRTRILVEFVDPKKLKDRLAGKDLKEYFAWTTHYGVHKNKDFFVITINSKTLHKGKNRLLALRDAFLCLGHELVHVKQYVRHELIDLDDDIVKFNGKKYAYIESGEGYFFSPWEIEAYGHETGLYACFKKKVLENQKKHE